MLFSFFTVNKIGEMLEMKGRRKGGGKGLPKSRIGTSLFSGCHHLAKSHRSKNSMGGEVNSISSWKELKNQKVKEHNLGSGEPLRSFLQSAAV